MFDAWRGFTTPELPADWHAKLTEMARQARGDILKMTTLAGSGHPGGSMSSVDIYITLYNMARVDPKNPRRDDRDRIIVSHGHTSPGVYAALAQVGFFDAETAVCGFRQGTSPFEGHVEQSVPGVEWDTGNLGQGLSVGVGRALYGRLSGQPFHTYVVMGDGEQQKGQISEARCQAVKYELSRLTAIVDWNRLQISGDIHTVMPQNIRAVWEADGWQVVEVDAHDFQALHAALYRATHNTGAPIMILARSVMGKGVSFMENQHKYHGSTIKPEQLPDALKELGGIPNNYPQLVARRKQGPPPRFNLPAHDYPKVNPGNPANYGVGDKLDNRSAWGKALVSVADANMGTPGFCMGVFDCDLAGSVKTDAFAAKYPDSFFQFGITEHSTAVVAGSLSAEKALAVWADFGMFGVAESYNQARLNDINHANLKLFCTHSGVNVGEDGKTHQSIDYFGLLNSTFGWKVITPADPNQTDRVTRYVLSTPGNFAVIMGRSIVPMVTDEAGRPCFGEQYRYRYGRMEQIRTGRRLVLVSAGNMLPYALEAWHKLNEKGRRVALVSVSDWSDLHPEDLSMIAGFESIVTLEDHNVKTGLGTAIASALFESGHRARFIKLGVSAYASSGTPAELYKLLRLDPDSIAEQVESIL